MNQLPKEIRPEMARARRLEWWTLAGMGSVVAAMYFAMGSSQAMKTAFIEDLLGLVPAVTFLVAARLEPRPPTRKYPYGFVRVDSLAFMASAVVLAAVGRLDMLHQLRDLELQLTHQLPRPLINHRTVHAGRDGR